MIKLLLIYIKWVVKYITIIRKLIKVLLEITYIPQLREWPFL